MLCLKCGYCWPTVADPSVPFIGCRIITDAALDYRRKFAWYVRHLEKRARKGDKLAQERLRFRGLLERRFQRETGTNAVT